MTNDEQATTKHCPDCAAEGLDGERPLEEFYRVKAERYAGGYRYGAYCKRHTKARTAAAAKNATEGSKLREASQRASRAWKQRNPEANRQHVADHRARKKAQRDPEPK